MRNRFDSVALVPLSLVFGVAIGVEMSVGKFPADLVSKLTVAIVGTWIALLIVEEFVYIVQQAMSWEDSPVTNIKVENDMPNDISITTRNGEMQDARRRGLARVRQERFNRFVRRLLGREIVPTVKPTEVGRDSV